jgi:hypothetical protein
MKGFTMSCTRALLSLTSLSALLAACSGGGGSAGQQPPVIAATSKSKGVVAVSIKIPARSAAASSRRRPQYVSVSTESLALTISQSGTPVLQEAVSLTPSNPNCTASAGATTCALTFPLAPGSYLGTVSTYDGAVVAGGATGHLLSQGQSLAVTVVGGQTNDLTLTLDGVPASISIVPAAGSTITGTQGTGFSVPSSAQSLLVNALDADGNTIVGPGTPTFTAQVSPSTGYTLTQPTIGAPNEIALAASGSAAAATITVTAAPANAGFSCSSSGIVCVASAGVSPHLHTLYLAGPSGLWTYTSPDDATWTLASTNTTTFGLPESIALAPNGSLIVADAGQYMAQVPILPELEIFTPPYTAAPVRNTHVSFPYLTAMTSSGTLLVADSQNLDALSAPYTATPTSASAAGNIEGIQADASANAIVALPYSAVSYSPPAYSQSTTISSSIGGYSALSAAGSFVIADLFGTYQLAVYAPPLASSSPVLIPLSGQPDGHVSFDSNGNVWVALNTGHLQKFPAPFTAGESPTVDLNLSATPNALGCDSSGDVLYFAQSVKFYNSSGANTVTVTPPSYASAFLYVK